MTGPLQIDTRAPLDLQLRLGWHLSRSHTGRIWPAVYILALLAAGIGIGMAIGALLGTELLSAALIAEGAVLAGLFAHILLTGRIARRQAALLAQSALRAGVLPLMLTPDGITVNARQLPWSAISGLSRWRGCTLIHLSPMDALIIPDADLPPGLTPESLTHRLQDWKDQ